MSFLETIMYESKPYRMGLYILGVFMSFLWALWRSRGGHEYVKSKVRWALPLYVGLSVLALLTTWNYIVGFLLEDRMHYADSKEWMKESSVFFDAYKAVSDSAKGWWWSSQLLMLTISLIMMLNVEGRRLGISRFTIFMYTMLAFGGAVSAAIPLAFHLLHRKKGYLLKATSIRATSSKRTTVTMSSTLSGAVSIPDEDSYVVDGDNISSRTSAQSQVFKPARSKSSTPKAKSKTSTVSNTQQEDTKLQFSQPPTTGMSLWGMLGLVSCAALAFLSVASFTKFSDFAFNFNLVFLHVILLLPCFLGTAAVRHDQSWRHESNILKISYAALAGAALAFHVHVTELAYRETGHSLAGMFAAGFSNLCQQAVSWDMMFSTIATFLYVAIESGLGAALAYGMIVPTFSPGVALPVYLLCKEIWPAWLAKSDDTQSATAVSPKKAKVLDDYNEMEDNEWNKSAKKVISPSRIRNLRSL